MSLAQQQHQREAARAARFGSVSNCASTPTLLRRTVASDLNTDFCLIRTNEQTSELIRKGTRAGIARRTIAHSIAICHDNASSQTAVQRCFSGWSQVQGAKQAALFIGFAVVSAEKAVQSKHANRHRVREENRHCEVTRRANLSRIKHSRNIHIKYNIHVNPLSCFNSDAARNATTSPSSSKHNSHSKRESCARTQPRFVRTRAAKRFIVEK